MTKEEAVTGKDSKTSSWRATAPLTPNPEPGPLNLCQFPLTSNRRPAARLFTASPSSTLSPVLSAGTAEPACP